MIKRVRWVVIRLMNKKRKKKLKCLCKNKLNFFFLSHLCRAISPFSSSTLPLYLLYPSIHPLRGGYPSFTHSKFITTIRTISIPYFSSFSFIFLSFSLSIFLLLSLSPPPYSSLSHTPHHHQQTKKIVINYFAFQKKKSLLHFHNIIKIL